MVMKRSLFTILFLLYLAKSSFSQTYWTEDFGNGAGCNQAQAAIAYSGTNGNWTISQTDGNGANANEWYISATSSNNGAGICDLSCPSSNNQTLHIGNVPTSPSAFLFCPTGDCGAAYDESDTTVKTSIRIESPVIDLTGLSSLKMSFIYLLKGQAGFDYGRLWFFDGVNWVADTIPPQTSGCVFNATWNYIVVDLPSFANNNPNFKMGFEWKNNGDGIGSDPSFAIDNIRVAQSFASVNTETEKLPFTYSISENKVNFLFSGNANHRLELYDLTGKLLTSVTDQSTIHLFNKGIYLITVWINDKQYVIKAISN
jgi:hypothetical protein